MISCDVCGGDVLDDQIYVIPDERTVCKNCYITYIVDPEAFDEVEA